MVCRPENKKKCTQKDGFANHHKKWRYFPHPQDWSLVSNAGANCHTHAQHILGEVTVAN